MNYCQEVKDNQAALKLINDKKELISFLNNLTLQINPENIQLHHHSINKSKVKPKPKYQVLLVADDHYVTLESDVYLIARTSFDQYKKDGYYISLTLVLITDGDPIFLERHVTAKK